MTNKIAVCVTSSHPIFELLVQPALTRTDISSSDVQRHGVAHILLDYPLTWAFRVLDTLNSIERARTLVVTQAHHQGYYDCLGSFHVSGVVGVTDEHAILGSIYAAAISQRTYQWQSPLTYMELRVTRQLIQGQDTKEVAKVLGISHKTVNAHVSNALCKYGYSSRAQFLTSLLGNRKTRILEP